MLRSLGMRLAAPSAIYGQKVQSGKLRHCPHQEVALSPLDQLYHDVHALDQQGVPKRDLVPYTATASSGPASQKDGDSGFFSSFMSSGAGASSSMAGGATAGKPSKLPTHPLSNLRGVYLHGDVGCGKTHLMDMFFEELPRGIHKKRVHFHQFMQQVHKDMHQVKKEHGKLLNGDQLMREVAKKQCEGAEVLCFDELVVTDIADAMILRRLFENMYAIGVCTVFTSNRPPSKLYDDGLNRGEFLPFIDILHERCHVHDMSSGTDHRLVGTVTETYLHPCNAANTAIFNAEWRSRTGGDPEKKRILTVYGREFAVKRAIGGVCRFTYRDLCTGDVSVADYSELAKNFHTLFLEDVPQMPAGNSDAKRRFISLLDELYQYKVKLFILSQVPLEQLEMKGTGELLHDANEESFYAGQLIGVGEDKFQMKRAISRLSEMRTKEYGKEKHLAGR